MQNNQQLDEGLRSQDLENLIYPLFEVDTYKSKMGEDQDVCVLTFKVKDRAPAKDLMEFIEKGFSFVLDADVSSGENKDGEYFVFVEISRDKNLTENIKEILYGVKKLSGINEFKFKYHKENNLYEANIDSLSNVIPLSPTAYESFIGKIKTENIKRFFNKTLMDDFILENNIITIIKPFDKKIQLKMINDSDTQAILETNQDKISVDEKSTSEIFWLTKVLGDYEITKFGDKFLFTNGDRAMFLQRI